MLVLLFFSLLLLSSSVAVEVEGVCGAEGKADGKAVGKAGACNCCEYPVTEIRRYPKPAITSRFACLRRIKDRSVLIITCWPCPIGCLAIASKLTIATSAAVQYQTR